MGGIERGPTTGGRWKCVCSISIKAKMMRDV